LGKVDAFGGEPIQIRGFKLRVTVDTEAVKAVLVGVNKKNIGFFHEG